VARLISLQTKYSNFPTQESCALRLSKLTRSPLTCCSAQSTTPPHQILEVVADTGPGPLPSSVTVTVTFPTPVAPPLSLPLALTLNVKLPVQLSNTGAVPNVSKATGPGHGGGKKLAPHSKTTLSAPQVSFCGYPGCSRELEPHQPSCLEPEQRATLQTNMVFRSYWPGRQM
jgi:hypothetical protein